MKRNILVGILLFLSPILVHAQSGLVCTGGDDPVTQSSFTVGQLFSLGISEDGYTNEGLQQPFLYRGTDTILHENRLFPVTYRPAERNPKGEPYLVEQPGHVTELLYLLPTRGIDSLLDVMAYGVTFTNDTTVIAPYSLATFDFALNNPLVLPEGSIPPVLWVNNKPAEFPVGATTPVKWNFTVANRLLTDTQWVNVKFPPCGTDNFSTDIADYPYDIILNEPFIAKDYEGNAYQTVRLDHLCWTSENLKSAQYADGASVPNPLIYGNNSHNLDYYGYLYNWNDAVRTPIAADTNGYVRGICPEGWRVPTVAELTLLTHYPSSELKSTTDWLNGEGTNSTEYTALPAGKHTGIRFENLLGEANFWSTTSSSPSLASYLLLTYGCNEALIRTDSILSSKSVRCLKN